MKVLISFALLLAAVISLDGESNDLNGDSRKSRKHYGLSYHNKCKDYVKTFTCMTSCKSIGFQVFRMDFKCKCSCHELKTTTILPFFKWRTNGTTKTWSRTHSPNLYHIVGTLSPATYPDYGSREDNQTTPADGSGLTTAIGSNSTDSAGAGANATDVEESAAAGGNPTAPAGGAGTETGAATGAAGDTVETTAPS